MLLYYITDRNQFSGTEAERRARLLEKVSEAATAGVDYVQLREKELPIRELESLSREVVQIIRAAHSKTRLLINSRTDVALASQADGVHLRSSDLSPVEVRRIWRDARQSSEGPVIAVSCHEEGEVMAAQKAGADFVVFGPVFEKNGLRDTGGRIDELAKVCGHRIPVFALGGVTMENAPVCVAAGASGIAGIRLFQENKIADVVKEVGVK